MNAVDVCIRETIRITEGGVHMGVCGKVDYSINIMIRDTARNILFGGDVPTNEAEVFIPF